MLKYFENTRVPQNTYPVRAEHCMSVKYLLHCRRHMRQQHTAVSNTSLGTVVGVTTHLPVSDHEHVCVHPGPPRPQGGAQRNSSSTQPGVNQQSTVTHSRYYYIMHKFYYT